MPNIDVFNKAIDVISKRRYDALVTNEARFKEIDSKIPEICEINKHLGNTGSDILRIIQSGKDVQIKISNLKEQNIQAQAMVKRLLINYGYPENYLDIKYHCEKCFDTGFVHNKRCTCLDELIRKLSVEQLNSYSQFKLCSFDTFSLSYYKDAINPEGQNPHTSMGVTLNYCKKYADTFSLNSKNILMLGGTGLGKTHLSLAIAERVIQKGYSVLYDSVINYLMKIESEHFGRDNTGKDTLQIILDADLVILDDLGAEYDTGFYVSTMYNIINTRLNKGLPTIISTNLAAKDIQAKYDSRIVSRIFGMYDYMKFFGDDIRTIKRRNGEYGEYNEEQTLMPYLK